MKGFWLGPALVVLSAQSALAAGDKARGADVFEDRCAICHVADGTGQGPRLNGVVGRKAATLKNVNYTAALKAAGITWSPATLDGFLSDPGKSVPGTAMTVHVPNAAQRADLIAYLASLK